MCGIAGTISDGRNPAATDAVGRMLEAIAHRGPDGRGVTVSPHGVLGHVRLSIVDLEGGVQPFSDPSGQVSLTFNGEIFNYVELRSALEAKGHRFRTQSDTEVLLHMYLEYGEQCVDALNGDFAFAILDERSGSLFAARDRIGVRPFYYCEDGAGLHFASEIKALIAGGYASGDPDPLGYVDTFLLWFPLAPRTAFKGVSELPPGHTLSVRNGVVRTRPYWQPTYPTVEEDRADPREEGEIAEEAAALLKEATRLRLRADVPVGSYLSGGLDSSIIAALAAQQVPHHLRTFSVAFEDAEFDEREFQRAMTATLQTAHDTVLCRGTDIAENFVDVVRHAERPILRTAPVPLYQLAAFVRQSGYKTVLTGEGADEVFGGYDIFKEAKIRRFCATDPSSTMRPQLYRRLYPYLPGLKAQSPRYLSAFFNASLDQIEDPLFSHLPRFATTKPLEVFFSEEVMREVGGYDPMEALRDRLPQGFTGWHPLAQAQYLEIAFLLPNYILSAQGDRVSMAHAVEGRFPFLDPRVVEHASRIPARMKLKGLREKHILKRALGRYVPAAVENRPKQPYRAPDASAFFSDGNAHEVTFLLSERSVEAAGLFNPRAVGKLQRKCQAGRATGTRDNMALVGILSAQLLQNAYNPPAGSTTNSARENGNVAAVDVK